MKKIFLTLVFVFLGFSPLIIFAQDSKLPTFTPPDLKVSIPGLNSLQKVTCQEGNICNIPWLGQYIAGLQRYAIGVIGIIAVIVLMIGGVIWLTSAGNPNQVGQAKKMIAGSLVGLFLVFGSYLILFLVNPNLTVMKSLQVGYIDKIDLDEIMAEIKNGAPISQESSELMKKFDKDGIISHTVGKSAETYKGQSCNQSIFSGGPVEFFTTGYYKPPYENSQKFFCDVGLQCSCPSGSSQIGPNKSLCGHKYKYCSPFAAGIPYCNKTASGVEPVVGHIAADGNCFNFGDKVCLGGKITLTVTDRGSAIKGRRFDIFSGQDRNTALAKTGIVLVTLGACP
jgi:3D (Asp-Asp-Asp) domain-containing protein